LTERLADPGLPAPARAARGVGLREFVQKETADVAIGAPVSWGSWE
jgi:hypothetical protein